VKKAAIRFRAVIELLPGAREQPTQAGRVAPFFVEFIGRAWYYVAPYPKSLERSVDGIKIKSGLAILHFCHDQKIEVAVRRIAAFSTATEQPNLPGIECSDKAAHDLAECLVLGREGAPVWAR